MTLPPAIEPHTLQTAQISTGLANTVAGTHDLRHFDEDQTTDKFAGPPLDPFYKHAHYVASLTLYYRAVQQIGWIEHTSDWDWYVVVTLRDGTRRGDDWPPSSNPDEQDQWCDGWMMPSLLFPDGSTGIADFPQDPTYNYGRTPIMLNSWTDDGTCTTTVIPIEDIATIEINQR